MNCPDCNKTASSHCDNPKCVWGWCIDCRIVFDHRGHKAPK